MTGKGNRFGIGPLDLPSGPSARRARDPGPMGVAVRESATSAQEASEGLVEQRRQNATDAKEFRAARDEGRVLLSLPVDAVATDALPRDRLDLDAVAVSDAMDELKSSIMERGQREPIEVFAAEDGRWQLKAGWRRLSALRQLRDETNDARFAHVLARVTAEGSDRADLYLDMVEENVIREDLSFAEMAQIAIELSRDPAAGMASVEDAVTRLYRAMNRPKRSYIRSFVTLMTELGGALPYPRAVSRDLGVEVARAIVQRDRAGVDDLVIALQRAETEEAQGLALRAYTAQARQPDAAPVKDRPAREKFEFRVGDVKVTARDGELRIRSAVDFASVDRLALERAIKAFNSALSGKG